jgi:hypothetical protein
LPPSRPMKQPTGRVNSPIPMIDPLDQYISIEKAGAELFDPPLGKHGFRTWAAKAGVAIYRGKVSYVRRRECLDAQARPISSSTSNEEPGSSATELSASERAAGLRVKLRKDWPNISQAPTARSPARPRSSVMS